MKKLRTFLCSSVLLIASSLIASEEVVINEDFNQTPLAEVFKVLKDKYQLRIAFANRDVKEINITVRIEQLNIRDAFKLILEETPMTFEVIDGRSVILRKKKNPSLDEQNFDLTGIISDENTGERLPYAYVWSETTKTSYTSNVEGFFSIPGVSTETRLRISYLGYQDTLVAVTDFHRERRINVQLVPLLNQLEEVVVLDDNSQLANFRPEEQPGKFTFSPKVSKIAPSAGEVDVFRTLQLLPGINATNEVSSGLTINGGTSNQNLVLFDGFTVYHVDHFFGYFSAFNPLAVKSLQLYKTGFEAKFGGRVSSVVDITGKDGNRNRVSGTLGLNLLSVNSSIEVPLSDDGTTLFFSGRRSYTDIWSSSLFENIFSIFENSLSDESGSTTSPPMMPPDGPPDGPPDSINPPPMEPSLSSSIEPEFYYTDMNIKLSSRLGTKNKLSFSFYDSNDILNYTETIDASFEDTLQVNTENLGFITWGNVGSSLKFSRLWNNNHFTQILASYSFYESMFREQSNTTSQSATLGETFTNTDQDQFNNIEDISFKIDHTVELNGIDRIEAGMGTSNFSTQLRHEVEDSILADQRSREELLLTGYLQGSFALANGLTLNPGLRTSYLTSTGNSYFEPRFSFSYHLSPEFVLNGAWGKYYQFINQSNTRNVLEGSRDFWILADNRAVPTQMATHHLLGVSYDRGPLNASINYFQKDFEGLLEYAFRNGKLITEFSDPGRVFTQGTGSSRGIELLVKRDFGAFDSWFSYTLGESRQQFDQINGGRSFYADHDQRHEMNWFGSYSIGNFEFSMVWIYGTGKPYSNVQSQQGVGRDRPGPTITQLNIEERNNERLPPYHRMDLSASYVTQLGNTQSRLSLSIFNLYNRENVLDRQVNLIQPGRGMRQPLITSNDLTLSGTSLNFSMEITF